MKITRITLGLLLAVAAATARSQSAAPMQFERLTLPSALEALRETNRQIRVARSAVDVASTEILRARALPNPTLSGQVSNTSAGRYNLPGTDRIVRLEQVFERGGKRDLRVGFAGAAEQAVRFDLADVTRQQRAALASAYYDLVSAQRIESIAQENVAGYQRLVEAAERRLRAGDIAAVDLSRLRVESNRAINEARAAQAAVAEARIALAAVLGVEAQAERIRAVDDFPELQAPQAMSPDRLDAAMSRRADAAAALARLTALDRARMLAESQRTRDVTLGVQAERAPSFGGNVFGLSASIPLLVNNDYSGDIARARADHAQASEELERIRGVIRSEVERNSAQLAAAFDRARRMLDSGLPEARKAAEAVEYAFNRGAAALTDLFDARRQFAAVRVEAITAQADYAKALNAYRESLALEEIH